MSSAARSVSSGGGALRRFLEEALDSDSVVDIAAPPGAGKTLQAVWLLLDRGLSAVASFPTHANQEKALLYVLDWVEERGARRLPVYVLDYAGVGQVCLLASPGRLRRLLEAFRRPGEGLEEAASRLVYSEPFYSAYAAAKGRGDAGSVEEAERVLRLLAALLERTGGGAGFRRAAAEVLRSVRDPCRRVCPLGVLAWVHRESIRALFREPRIYTWRGRVAEQAGPRARRLLVHGSPDLFLEHLHEIRRGRLEPRWLLCPRILLHWSLAGARRRGGRPGSIVARRSLVLAPHAALRHVARVVSRRSQAAGSPGPRLLLVDEYDRLLRGDRLPVLSLADLHRSRALLLEVLDAGPGSSLHGVELTEYTVLYASIALEALDEAETLLRRSLEEHVYTPVAPAFRETVLSHQHDPLLNTDYHPLSPRTLHLKHLQHTHLLPLLAAPHHAAHHHTGLPPHTLHPRLREAAQALHTLHRRTGTAWVVGVLSAYLAPLLRVPRFAVYYVECGGEGGGGLCAESLDLALYRLLGMARRAVLVSATPVDWSTLQLGPGQALEPSVYRAVAAGARHTVTVFQGPETLEYSDRLVKRYRAQLRVYTRRQLEEIRVALEEQRPPRWLGRDATEKLELDILQVHPFTETAQAYTALVKRAPLPRLEPPRRPKPPAPREEAEAYLERLRQYLAVLAQLRASGRRVLVLAQNKAIARDIARALGLEPCTPRACGEHADPEKLSHYEAGGVAVTWFRSRLARGVDLRETYDAVLVVGSPYPHPYLYSNTVAGYGPNATKLAVKKKLCSREARACTEAYLTVPPRAFMEAVAEMVQAAGRATRSMLRAQEPRPVLIVYPLYLEGRIHQYAPAWFKKAPAIM